MTALSVLPTFDDHPDTLEKLRAAYNRCINAIDTSCMHPRNRTRCQDACRHLYSTYMDDNKQVMTNLLRRVEQCAAQQPANIQELSALAKELNRHNRNLCRLTCLFSQNICDYYVTKDANNIPEGTPIECDSFLAKVESLVRELDEGKVVRVPYHELYPSE